MDAQVLVLIPQFGNLSKIGSLGVKIAAFELDIGQMIEYVGFPPLFRADTRPNYLPNSHRFRQLVHSVESLNSV